MSLASLEENYLITLDREGKEIYKTMIQVEDDWIAATGFRHLDLGNRTHLLVADTTDLPPLDELSATRRAFKAYIDANLNGRPATIGDRSTALPVWITPGGKVSIAESLEHDQLISATEIRIRHQPAFRGSKLNPDEILALFEEWIMRAHRSIADRIKHRRKSLLGEAEIELKELEEQRRSTLELIRQHEGHISARRSTGTATHIRVRSGRKSWPATIATVGLIHGNSATEVIHFTDRQRQPKEGQQHPIASIGQLVFYSSAPTGVSH